MKIYLILLVLVKCLCVLVRGEGLERPEKKDGSELTDSAEDERDFVALLKSYQGFGKKYPKLRLKGIFKDSEDSFAGSFHGHPCKRECREGQSLTCYYRMIVHEYQQLGSECKQCKNNPKLCKLKHCIYGDGVPTPLMVVNRQFPAPAIEVCDKDHIVVDVYNYLAEPTTMHWHGLHMSKTPDMDGAPFTTQYPIQTGEFYRYNFPIDRHGTIWYHSHMGWQRGFGVAGSFIIRQPYEKNHHRHLYDYDFGKHSLIIMDSLYNFDTGSLGNLVINGKGRSPFNDWPDNDPRHHYLRLTVICGKSYRMRLIHNGVFNCPVEMSIQDHKMLLISMDGNDIEPVWADKLYSTSAERFDFVLHANQRPGNYWLRVKGYNNCTQYNLFQGAVIHYKGAESYQLPRGNILDSDRIPKVRVNVIQEAVLEGDGTEVILADLKTTDLRAIENIPWPRKAKWVTHYSSFGLKEPFRDWMVTENIIFRFPTLSLLHAHRIIDEEEFYCNQTSLIRKGRNCKTEYCECTHVIRLPAYRFVEIITVNYMDVTHPFHIHGYTFKVVGMGENMSHEDLDNIEGLDRQGRLKRHPYNYPSVLKDTAQVPASGYLIARFYTDNPGFWLYHCHIELHTLIGMNAILKIGESHEIMHIPPKAATVL